MKKKIILGADVAAAVQGLTPDQLQALAQWLDDQAKALLQSSQAPPPIYFGPWPPPLLKPGPQRN